MPRASSRWPRPPTRTSSSGSTRGAAASCRWTGCTSRAGWRAASCAAASRSASTATSPACSPPAPTGRRPGSTPRSRRLYRELHRLGHAHSVEIWEDGALAGGLYGVALGAAFFGESMFSRRRDASKFALIALVARLRAGGFRAARHPVRHRALARLGAVEIGRAAYHQRLRGGGEPAGGLPGAAARTPAVSRCCSSAPRRRSAGGRAPRAPATRRTSSPRTAARPRACRGCAGTRRRRRPGRPRGTRQVSAVISRCPKRAVSPTPHVDVLRWRRSACRARAGAARSAPRVAWLVGDLRATAPPPPARPPWPAPPPAGARIIARSRSA